MTVGRVALERFHNTRIRFVRVVRRFSAAFDAVPIPALYAGLKARTTRPTGYSNLRNTLAARHAP